MVQPDGSIDPLAPPQPTMAERDLGPGRRAAGRMARADFPVGGRGMIHLRVVSPSDLTEKIIALLAGDPGVLNLVVLPGRARNP